MKKSYLVLFISFTTLALARTSNSLDILNRIKNKTLQQGDTERDNALTKGLHEVERKNKPKVKTEAQKTKKGMVAQNDTVPPAKAGTQLSYTSKYDFVQGDKIIAYEDFNTVN